MFDRNLRSQSFDDAVVLRDRDHRGPRRGHQPHTYGPPDYRQRAASVTHPSPAPAPSSPNPYPLSHPSTHNPILATPVTPINTSITPTFSTPDPLSLITAPLTPTNTSLSPSPSPSPSYSTLNATLIPDTKSSSSSSPFSTGEHSADLNPHPHSSEGQGQGVVGGHGGEQLLGTPPRIITQIHTETQSLISSHTMLSTSPRTSTKAVSVTSKTSVDLDSNVSQGKPHLQPHSVPSSPSRHSNYGNCHILDRFMLIRIHEMCVPMIEMLIFWSLDL